MANRHDVEEEKEREGEDEGANERCAAPLRGRVVQPFSDTCRRLKYINRFILSLFSVFSKTRTRHQLTVLLHVSRLLLKSPLLHTPDPHPSPDRRLSGSWPSLLAIMGVSPRFALQAPLSAPVASCACHYETLPQLLTFPFPDYTFHFAQLPG